MTRQRFASVLFLLAALVGAAHAADPKLAQLSAVPASDKLTFDVIYKTGPQAPDKPAVAGAWLLTAADPIPIRSGVRPDDRAIDLYSGTPSAPILICRVLVRYHKNKTGWVPYFQLNEEPALVRVNGQWQPIQIGGAPALLVQRGNLVPTAEGYFPSLEFGLASSALPIVGWVVR